MNSRLKPMKTQLPIPPPKTGWHMAPDWHGNRFDHDRYWVKFKEKICLWELRGNLNKLPVQTLLMLNSDKTNQIPAPGPLLGWKRPEKTLQDALAEVGGAAVAGDRGVEGEGKGESQGQTQAGIANKYVEEDIQSGVLPAESLVTGNAWSVSPRARAESVETRGLNRQDQLLIANNLYQNPTRDLTRYLNNWSPIIAALG